MASPLVYLHGAAAPPATVVELFSRRFRVVALPAEDFGTPHALAAAISALGIDAFDLVAPTTAGVAALELALREPARVTALVLEGPPASGPDARFAQIATPALVLCGTADDAWAIARAGAYTSVLPNAHLVYVYAAGRAVSADRPEAFADVVTDFLERHEAFVIRRTETVIHP
jgi:pimeloyl-ACP methyl ester carboxylesterase